MKKKNILITGATSGIGEATAITLAKDVHNLILTGRRTEKLKVLSDELTNKYNCKVFTLNFDITNKNEVEKAFNSLPLEYQNIDVLINNAGLAIGMDTIDKGDSLDWDIVIDTNIKGVLYMTKCVIPNMIKSQKGHIINIGSIAGRQSYMNGNVYCATKSAINSLSEGMRLDLLKKGIKVSQVQPGAVETEFSIIRYKGNQNLAENVYKGFTPLKAEDIANTIKYIIDAPEHVNIAEMLILPSAQGNATTINRD